ncbi:Insertion element protein [Natrialba chahannaoensis JCM 10990]|uniref:Insertion element protein n=1 Tax=Natrialba chahannaoensis JCM 10990 TaxID=1227492 RepID=M0B674_9EURY|nr:Insertion element protein [Natrialba chahannaoensis JCM 10990]
MIPLDVFGLESVAADLLEQPDETIRHLLTVCEKEPLTVYTGGFRAYGPLSEDDAFDHEYVTHGDREYADGDVHVNTYEGDGSLLRPWLLPHRGISKDELTQYLRAFQLRRKPLGSREEKHSNALSKPRYEINKVLTRERRETLYS